MAAVTELPPGFGGLSLLRPHGNPALRFKRSRGKRVTWASADQLCQIRMFLAEDAPVLAGMAQEQLQVKSSRFMHNAVDLPPGFGGGVTSCLKVDAETLASSVVATTPWRCPQKIVLDASWHVRAGEESKEIEAQKLRESKVLEAVYPRVSAIPDSSAEPLEASVLVDDSQIPIISVVSPDEDSDGDDNQMQGTSSSEPKPHNYGYKQAVLSGSALRSNAGSQAAFGPSFTVSGVATSSDRNLNGAQPDHVAATAIAALSQAKDQGSSIDPSLLLQLLANPSLVETLSGVRNNSMVNTSNGNLVAPPNQSVTGSNEMAQTVKNLTSNTVSTITQNVSSMGFSEASYSPYGSAQGKFMPSGSASSSTASVSSPWVAAAAAAAVQVSSSSSSEVIPPGFANFSSQGASEVVASSSMVQQQQQQHQMASSMQYMSCQPSTSQQPVGVHGRPPLSRYDEQYFKDLIMQHGGTAATAAAAAAAAAAAGGNGASINGPPGFEFKSFESSKPRRACAYFNTAKGCRNGLKCGFLHERSDGKRPGIEFPQQQQQQQQQHAGKRMRV